MAQLEDIQEANRLSWNHATARHNVQKGDLTEFFRSGGSTLFPEEKSLLGEIRGKNLVHLQCNSGQDSLSIARELGARVLGVDFSEAAVEAAERLAEESGIEARFLRSEVYHWLEQAESEDEGPIDVVFSSYGAIPWLSDLERWGRGLYRRLRPGGRFVLIEFHPLVFVFDDEGKWKPLYDYMGGAMIEELDGVSDYVGESGSSLMPDPKGGGGELAPYENPHPAYSYAWGLGETISALIGAGFHLTQVEEYPYSNGWRPFPQMVEKPGRRIYLPEGVPKMPLMFSLVCQKPAA